MGALFTGRTARCVAAIAATTSLTLLTACATAPPAAPPAPVVVQPPLDQRVAWILRLEAQRWMADPAEPAANLATLLNDPAPVVRARAALAVGRVRHPDGLDLLVPLLADTDADTRAGVVFAIGLLGRAAAEGALRTALTDPVEEVRARAAEALGLLAAQVGGPRARWRTSAEAVSVAFGDCPGRIVAIAPDDEGPQPPAVEACRLALLALVRLGDYDSLARVALAADGRPASAWWPVAYALQRIGDPRAHAPLAHLLRSAGVYATGGARRGRAPPPAAQSVARRLAVEPTADPRLRAVAIRTLGRPGTREDADVLLTLIAQRDLGTAFLLEVLSALGATTDARAFDVAVDWVTDRRPQVRAAALGAAARLDGDAFIAIASSLPADPEWSVRAALATALGGLEPERVRYALTELLGDADQRVRGPALEALARVGAPDLVSRVLEALTEPDYALRATAARVAGRLAFTGAQAALGSAYERGASDAAIAARLAALEAAHAIDAAGARPLLDRAAREDGSWAVRLRAAELAGMDTEPRRPADLRFPAAFFASEALLHPPFSPVALVETRGGVIEIELDVVGAPLTTRNFIDLARAGFYNGLRVHRVVQNFVAQAGDPRGDGPGGPGYAIVDELGWRPYVRGTVGMALSSRDTAGSQFFVTVSPQPHLDGRYTVFGRVIRGMELVDGWVPGDVIERIRIWDGVTLK